MWKINNILKMALDLVRTAIAKLDPNVKIGSKTLIKYGAHLITRDGGKIFIGKRCIIESGAFLDTCGGFITIGSNSSVQIGAVLYGHGGLTIGNGVRIATGTKIIPANHRFDNLDLDIYKQGTSKKGIVIEDNVWIGANCIVLDGVKINEGCVIAAGCVVTTTTEKNCIYGGNPARKLRAR